MATIARLEPLKPWPKPVSASNNPGLLQKKTVNKGNTIKYEPLKPGDIVVCQSVRYPESKAIYKLKKFVSSFMRQDSWQAEDICTKKVVHITESGNTIRLAEPQEIVKYKLRNQVYYSE